MPRTNDMIPSKYLKKGDVGLGQLWTIKGIEQVNVAKEDDEPQMKWILHFNETPKGLALNKTNIQRLEKILNSDDTDGWLGKQVVLFWDESVEYMGELKGGIRVRAPKTKEEVDLPF